MIGAAGQLGRSLQITAPTWTEVVAPVRTLCDLTNADHIERWLIDVQPDIVFNAAAYTAVDAAESDEASAGLINAQSVGRLAEAIKRHGARLVHVSTDFVFDGATSRPYCPDDAPNPINAYGRTKLKGEQAILGSGVDSLIVRTAWVYAGQGKNFVHTMLRLMRERDEIGVVADQIGTPTYARNLARVLWTLVEQDASGCYHFTDSGVASWYDFAVAIEEEALAAGLLESNTTIVPIASSEYPTPARRPRFSVLDKSKTWAAIGNTGQHWRLALREMIQGMKHDG